jgi:hypothetical protein
LRVAEHRHRHENMRFLAITLLAALLAQPTIAAAGEKCPWREPGKFHPWQTSKILRDDKWADVYIDVAEDGSALKCYVGKTNILKGDRFWACKAFLDDWKIAPILKDDKSMRGTVERKFIIFGDAHIAADRKARKQWFLDHPNERPACYPE